LELLGSTGLLTGLQKYSGSKVRQRGSSPKLLVLDPGLLTAMAGVDPESVRLDPDFRGRLIETAVGAHLVNTAGRDAEVGWWREGDREVDFVVSDRSAVLAIEVGSGRRKGSLPGMDAFGRTYESRKLLVGSDGLPLEVALSTPASDLLRA
jgi:predicted AAA+ superfamily ATPase